ncbi:MAG: alpha/beta hydrolase [Actinomycetota bacterium]|nr:alpha/beta hydrolase [Actinomycetota bacterium]
MAAAAVILRHMQATSFVEVRGQKTRLLDAGEGKPVVVLHGWGGRIESMAPVVDCLLTRFRVLAFDLPGFGESPIPPTVWGTPDYALYARDVLLEAGVRKAHFIGHSFGAKTSLFLAAEHPGAVDKLVLVASSGLRRAPSFAARAKRLASRGARAAGRLGEPGRRVRSFVYRHVASSDYREAGALRPILVKAVNEDLSSLLSSVPASTLLVWGTEDDVVPLEHARAMERLIPDAGLVLLEGAGHFPHLDAADAFCRIVRHFLGAPLAP